jgi:hypothetical protein
LLFDLIRNLWSLDIFIILKLHDPDPSSNRIISAYIPNPPSLLPRLLLKISAALFIVAASVNSCSPDVTNPLLATRQR